LLNLLVTTWIDIHSIQKGIQSTLTPKVRESQIYTNNRVTQIHPMKHIVEIKEVELDPTKMLCLTFWSQHGLTFTQYKKEYKAP